MSKDEIEKSVKVMPKREYPWDRPNNFESREEVVSEEREFKRLMRSERKKLKTLKHAGVLERFYTDGVPS